MLSLVNYSDDESDEHMSDEESAAAVLSTRLQLPAPKKQNFDTETAEDNHINAKKEKTQEPDISDDDEEITEAVIQLKLPNPKHEAKILAEEDDDEFLHKKAVSTAKPPPKPARKPVQITIPSLNEFKDDVKVQKKVATTGLPMKGTFSGLLGILPRPKTDQFMPVGVAGPSVIEQQQPKASSSDTKPQIKKVTSLIPDSVKRARAAKLAKETKNKKAQSDDSDDADSEGENDFFSLDKKEKLPEITTNEIQLMVAKRAAKIAENKNKINQALEPTVFEEEPEVEMLPMAAPQRVENDQLRKLTGGNRAKRARVEEGINFIDISDADLKPSTQDFLRTQLASQTQFVPTGKLVGYDSTSKRKSQITFLAQKALANEQELEALWSANRQNQRASHNKYGF